MPGPVTAQIRDRMEQLVELLGDPCDISLRAIAKKHAMPFEREKETLERLLIHEALVESEGRQDLAARLMGESRITLASWLRRLRLRRRAA